MHGANEYKGASAKLTLVYYKSINVFFHVDERRRNASSSIAR
jgi:hypothetical protein